MTKKEAIDEIAKLTGLSKIAAGKLLKAYAVTYTELREETKNLAISELTVTKGEFIQRIATKSGQSYNDAEKMHEAFGLTVVNAFNTYDKIIFRGAITFSISNRAAGSGRKPKQGKVIKFEKTGGNYDKN